jgi:trimeric autotransporter adhesin
MASVVVNGDTSGAVTLSAPAVAGTVTVTLPSTSGTMAVGGGTITTLTTTSDITVQGLTVGRGAGAVATNTAVGASALAANQAGGTNNTAIGNAALDANTTGDENTAVGSDALGANTTASSNTAVGYQAGYLLTGERSVFVGRQAGQAMTTGSFNTIVGDQAGYNATTGTFNTFIGQGSGEAITTGSKNSILGKYNGNSGGLDIRTASNYIVLSDGDGNPRNYIDNNGYNYLLGSGGGRLYFRDTSNTAQYSIQSTAGTFYIFSAVNYALLNGTGFSSWTFASDVRIKENIVDLDYGLNSIMALKPRRFNYISNKHNDIGFIAQEVKQVVPEAVTGEEIEFSENDTQQERAEKTMGVSKDLLIPVLVKAIQELKAIVDAQAVEIAALKGTA